MDIERLQTEHMQLKAALIDLVGVSTPEELEQLEAVMRLMPMTEVDKVATLNAIHTLIRVLAP